MSEVIDEVCKIYPPVLKKVYEAFAQAHGHDGIILGAGGSTDTFGTVSSTVHISAEGFPGAEVHAHLRREVASVPTQSGEYTHAYLGLSSLEVRVDQTTEEGRTVATAMHAAGLQAYLREH